MKLLFLGSGSAFTIGTNNFHSNMLLINEKNAKLMIDCGSDARFSLYKQGFDYKDITDVYISHLHADHAGGLEWLAFTRKFNGDLSSLPKPNLYISAQLVDDLWNNTLSGGLSSIQAEVSTLDTFFNVHPIKSNDCFEWSGVEFRLVQTVHIVNAFSFMESYGLMFSVNGIKVFITTDTQFAPNQLIDFYKMSDIIFHDCETVANMSGVHANYKELVLLPAEIKAKMWLYHYNPGPLPDARADGFRGFVEPGQVFDFSHPETLEGK